ncbi:hypothetical protein RRG08_026762 [Elysia crispata]|uniref:Uncharacterized protein n=1 Tax=Elysia crispata TaxID=231223 RepID=A0AAE1AQ34_9GAST|nr:hypothetical protein RRG08_026762 [Elysia crispata]
MFQNKSLQWRSDSIGKTNLISRGTCAAVRLIALFLVSMRRRRPLVSQVPASPEAAWFVYLDELSSSKLISPERALYIFPF